MPLSLAQASFVVDSALNKARETNARSLAIAMLDVTGQDAIGAVGISGQASESGVLCAGIGMKAAGRKAGLGRDPA